MSEIRRAALDNADTLARQRGITDLLDPRVCLPCRVYGDHADCAQMSIAKKAECLCGCARSLENRKGKES